ncbi:MAG: hypothetical protein IPI27_05380 [Betaproteobacteria bacterium]|nr:hypothetical protein [Betaproteobacteria bacterium]
MREQLVRVVAARIPGVGWFARSARRADFRIETTADKSVCGPSAVTSSYVSNIEQWNFGMSRHEPDWPRPGQGA